MRTKDVRPMSQTVTRTIRLSPADNVVVARAALRADTRVEEEALTTLDPIDPGHKVATQAISKGDTIRKYDQIIGIAETDILPGQHVHTHNLRMDNFDRDYRFSESVRSLDFVAPEQAATFEGIVRSDGRVGTRNYIGVLTSVNCSASVARHVTKRFQEDVMAEFPNVDGVVALTHDHGCGGCAGIGLNYIQRTLSGYSRHPNFYAVVIIGLGCEANQIGAMMEAEKLNPSDKLHAFTIQDSGGSAAAA
ncbi:MAG TPA: galactonate dehydratase, partial [Gammaproteobacteria bacterium]|nr:galactonate dehydratase [Gammaproteobacteria bacterium]